jgi:3-oxoacyl-[acyl-carrier protein] reductase
MTAGRVGSVSAMSDVTPPLRGRRILITGAATGIGAAAVRVLTEAGAEIVATYHRTPPPEDLLATRLQCDARDADAVSTTVQQAAEHLGGLDVLVNAAGLWQPGVPGYISADEISFLLDTNVKATILTNQAAYAVMKSAGGRIINFGSSEAVMGSPISAIYAATKGAVQAWTRSAARAWAADNVTVNAPAPAMYERMAPGDGELPLAEILAAVPADVVVGLEIPMRGLAESGVGPMDRLRPCVAAARELCNR